MGTALADASPVVRTRPVVPHETVRQEYGMTRGGGPADQAPGGGHEPVLVARIAELLAVAEAGVLVDATVGAGGHAHALLTASGPGVHLVGLDRDPGALALARERLAAFGERAQLVHAGYDELTDVIGNAAPAGLPVLGVLYDLGLSSMQLDTPGRGFAFRTAEPLDLRMDPGAAGPDAAELVNTLSEASLGDLLRRFGEEPHARRIARAIVRARPVHSTAALADVVRGAVPPAVRHGRTHPATRTFQALRIAVNAELDRFSASLPQALDLVRPADAGGPGGRGGRVAVLSYHSLEDRIAKRIFADARAGCVCPPDLPVCVCGRTPWVVDLLRGIERPSAEEIADNPRARPAKLRVVEKTAARPPAS